MTKSSTLAGPLAVVAWYYIRGRCCAGRRGASLGGLLAAGSVRSRGLNAAVVLAHAERDLLGWLGLAIIGRSSC